MNLTPGQKVRVVFNPKTWPIHSAVYILEGHDDVGFWLRRKDGWQRYLLRVDVESIEPVDGPDGPQEEVAGA